MLLVSIHLPVLVINPKPPLTDMTTLTRSRADLNADLQLGCTVSPQEGILVNPPNTSRHDSELLEVANITSVWLDVTEDRNTSIFDAPPWASETDNFPQALD